MRLFARIRQWEHWPFPVFYAPLLPAWLGYYLRSRSLWYFTAANPTLTFGGFEGESKSEQYAQLPPHLCPRTLVVQPGWPLEIVLVQMRELGLSFPLVAKPDVGMKGILFRKVVNEKQLAQYHQHMPATYLVQEFLDMPLEVSIFYCRMPGAAKGTITAFIKKRLLQVTGNGRSTISELIAQDEELREFGRPVERQLGAQMQLVLPEGTPFVLSHVANLVNGARFSSLHHLIDEELCGVFDKISHQSQFYYGRYDIKCTVPTDLHTGSNFKILEFNGAGSVPNHVFAGGYTRQQAYAEIRRHWQLLYEISMVNRNLGFRTPGIWEGQAFLQQSKKHFNRLKALDKRLVLA